MPTSDADLDDQLRAAMKTLDSEVPSGYFEALPDLTLARLEGTMQHGTQGTTENASAAPPSATPPSATTNTEDSGLHDIRNLAQSTKQRLSSRRVGTIPPVSEDDLIASSSAGFKAVALPQPAKMVSLPELAELPSKKEVLAKEKAAAKAEKAEKKSAPKLEAAAPAVETPAPAVPARQAFSLPSAQKKSKKGVIAIVGIGLAAAAGAAIFVTTQNKDGAAKQAAPAVAVTNTVAPAAPNGTAVGGAGAGSAAVSADVQKAQDEVAKAEADAEKERAELAAAQAAAPPPAETKADVPVKAAPKNVKGHGAGGKEKVETTPVKTDETKSTDKGKDTTKKDAPKTGSGGEGEPDFNELLKEAGVKDQQQKKPVLDKKELTGDDFKNGMAAVSSKAQACYKGTQGTATVKMTIAPSGKIAKVSVSGPFATTPEGACVVSAVKGASFPAWDGHPASFTYPILLSE